MQNFILWFLPDLCWRGPMISWISTAIPHGSNARIAQHTRPIRPLASGQLEHLMRWDLRYCERLALLTPMWPERSNGLLFVASQSVVGWKAGWTACGEIEIKHSLPRACLSFLDWRMRDGCSLAPHWVSFARFHGFPECGADPFGSEEVSLFNTAISFVRS